MLISGLGGRTAPGQLGAGFTAGGAVAQPAARSKAPTAIHIVLLVRLIEVLKDCRRRF